MIEFPFNLDRAIQSTAFLLLLNNEKMCSFRLLNLAYMADRDYLINKRMRIIGGVVEATADGPIIMELYKLIKGQGEGQDKWNECIVTADKEIRLIKNPFLGDLSLAHAKTLHKVNENYKELCLPDEWKKRYTESDKIITYLDILSTTDNLGWEKVVVDNIKDEQYLTALYGA